MVAEYTESLKELAIIREKYEKYNKNTYAAVLQITTISKLRLSSRINKFDPIATVQVSKTVIETLKSELKKSFG